MWTGEGQGGGRGRIRDTQSHHIYNCKNTRSTSDVPSASLAFHLPVSLTKSVSSLWLVVKDRLKSDCTGTATAEQAREGLRVQAVKLSAVTCPHKCKRNQKGTLGLAVPL